MVVSVLRARTYIVVALCLLCLRCEGIGFTSDKNTCSDPCGKPTAWDEFTAFEVKVTAPGRAGYQFFRGQFDEESGDIQIDVDGSDGKETTKGKILLVGGTVLATQGPTIEPGYEIDVLDVPILEELLVNRLLGRVLPEGPARLRGMHKIDFSDRKTGIQFATPSAQGFVPAPWHVTGEVNVLAPDLVEYQLRLTVISEAAQGQGTRYDQNLTGRLSKTANAKIDDGLKLEGWNLFELGVHSRKQNGGTTIDYNAAPASVCYKTVADIRKKIALDNYPGEPDLTKNFTGFWKENCEDAFGLQIMPYETAGKYSVTFCGPGGCGTAGEEGKNTFINKDPDYVVVSEDELKIRNAKDEGET